MIRRLAFAFVVSLSVAACYSPGIRDGQFSCAGGGACPSGFTCSCGLCVQSPSATCSGDMSGAGGGHDMAMTMTGGPCTNGGKRAMGDPGLSGVAVCPAAWANAGLLSTPSCMGRPTQNGKDASGNKCSAADNCAMGWHICRGEAELTSKGFTSAHCHALAGGLWVTTQPNVVPSNPPSGPPQCGTGEQHFVFGCGDTGGATMSCSILDHSLTDAPGGADGCAALTSGDFTCGANNPPGTLEINSVVKTTIAGGGVLCCSN